MEEEDGKKQFLITTSTGIWEYKGQKNYEIHVVFTNKMKNKKGHWPRGTCSGPYALDEVNVRQKTCRSPTLQGESCPGEYSHSLFTTLSGTAYKKNFLF